MRIQHNIMAMNAYRNYSNNTSALSKNLERLSSGYKINRAGDDAAGLAISEKMRAQITGLDAAQKNVKDGVSLVNTAEGAMQEIQDMLNRMVSLATQSSNGTYDNEVDRKNLQAEVDQLKEEINRIADSANFNGIKLLDGSLAETATMSSPSEQSFTFAESATAGVGELPDVDNTAEVGFATILHNVPGLSEGTTFKVNMNNTTFVNDSTKDDLTLSLTRGGEEVVKITMAGDDQGTMDANAIATKIADAITNNTISADGIELGGKAEIDTDGNFLIDGQKFKVEAVGDALKFTQIEPPESTDDEFDGQMTVAMTGVGTVSSSSSSSSNSSALGALSGVAQRVDLKATSNTGSVNFAGLDKNAIIEAIKAYNDGVSAGGDLIEDGAAITLNVASGKLVIQAEDGGGTARTIATATSTISGLSSEGDTTTLEFTYGTDDTSVGSVEITQIGSTAPAETDVAAAISTGYTYIAVGTVTAQPTSKEIDYTPAEYDTPAGQIFTLDFTNLAVTPDANTTMVVNVAGRDFEITLDSSDTDSTGSNVDSETVVSKLVAAINTANANAQAELDRAAAAGEDPDADIMSKALYDVGTKVFYTAAVDATSDSKLTLTADAPSDIQDADLQALTDANKKGSYTITVKNPGATAAPSTPSGAVIPSSRDYNAQTDSVNAKAAGKERLASTYFTLTDDMVEEGAQIRIGDDVYTFTANATGANDIDISSGDLATIADNLTNKSDSNHMYSIGYENGRITVTEKKEYGALDASQKSYTLDTKESIAASLGFTAASKNLGVEPRGGLSLQIGDTSDTYNQMTVYIGDMHTYALGIEDLDISTPEAAQDAIDTIKNAINYVSSVRGNLGAVSNRLDHTANNLSVMAENITDAESTIRDTDIAEEMMAYTKNNILVQSAQAMLAQANQVPQGVLQLLQ